MRAQHYSHCAQETVKEADLEMCILTLLLGLACVFSSDGQGSASFFRWCTYWCGHRPAVAPVGATSRASGGSSKSSRPAIGCTAYLLRVFFPSFLLEQLDSPGSFSGPCPRKRSK